MKHVSSIPDRMSPDFSGDFQLFPAEKNRKLARSHLKNPWSPVREYCFHVSSISDVFLMELARTPSLRQLWRWGFFIHLSHSPTSLHWPSISIIYYSFFCVSHTLVICWTNNAFSILYTSTLNNGRIYCYFAVVLYMSYLMHFVLSFFFIFYR